MNQWVFILLISMSAGHYSTYAFENKISAKKYLISIVAIMEFFLFIDNAMRGIMIPDNFVFCLLVSAATAICATLVHVYRLKNAKKA